MRGYLALNLSLGYCVNVVDFRRHFGWSCSCWSPMRPVKSAQLIKVANLLKALGSIKMAPCNIARTRADSSGPFDKQVFGLSVYRDNSGPTGRRPPAHSNVLSTPVGKGRRLTGPKAVLAMCVCVRACAHVWWVTVDGHSKCEGTFTAQHSGKRDILNLLSADHIWGTEHTNGVTTTSPEAISNCSKSQSN